jgi:hypothetical protein
MHRETAPNNLPSLLAELGTETGSGNGNRGTETGPQLVSPSSVVCGPLSVVRYSSQTELFHPRMRLTAGQSGFGFEGDRPATASRYRPGPEGAASPAKSRSRQARVPTANRAIRNRVPVEQAPPVQIPQRMATPVSPRAVKKPAARHLGLHLIPCLSFITEGTS